MTSWPMRLHPSHKGHRFRLPHWNPYQYLDILMVGRAIIVTRDETGKEYIFDRDDMNTDWMHVGPSPTPPPDGKTNITNKFV